MSLTKYAKGKRMVQEDKIKQIEQNKADIEDLKGQVEEIPIVEANPVLEGTEGDLTSLQVGETKYKVPQPTEVVANPTLAGTEANLEGLQVGETKYKVGGGAELYEHRITDGTNSFAILTNTSEAFTFATLKTYLATNMPNVRIDGKTLDNSEYKVKSYMYYPTADVILTSTTGSFGTPYFNSLTSDTVTKIL